MTKQVIIIRNDLNMRKGKIASQASHSSMAFLTRNGNWTDIMFNSIPENWEEAKEWMENSFTKICLQCNSKEELYDLYNKAKEDNLTVHMIVDNGTTEFNGVKTETCICIGPHYSEKIDPITKHLKLL